MLPDGHEEWRPIPGHAPFEASSLGRIRNATTGTIRKTARTAGYRALRLTNQSDPSRVHHLVALAFIGPRPPGMVINHIDSDRANNRPENLEYVTPGENVRHCVRVGRANRPKGEEHFRALLTADDVIAIRGEYSAGAIRLRDLAERYAVSMRCIRSVIKGHSWAHLPGAVCRDERRTAFSKRVHHTA